MRKPKDRFRALSDRTLKVAVLAGGQVLSRARDEVADLV